MSEEPKGRAKGGVARARKLPANRRAEIGRNAAAARWGIKATHIGNFKDELGLDVDCYVLGDALKTPMIGQTGMARALGLSPRGNALPRFLDTIAMADVGGAELKQKLENPVKFQWSSVGAGTPPITVFGSDAALLIDICQAIGAASAKGKLKEPRYRVLVQQAQIILGASAKNGIRNLVYALSGYSPSTEEVIAAFKLYVQEEAKKYEPEFPNELYVQWHRLYQIPVPVRGKPWHFKHLTVNHIYHPLAQSSGKILNLLRALRANDGDRQKKLFSFLSEIGTRALRMHLGRVLEMAESSYTSEEYEAKVRRRFGDQGELTLVYPSDPNASPQPPSQSPPDAPETLH